MKKLGKILVLVLSLAIITSAIVLVASAEEKTDAPFIIDGEAWGDETKTFAQAMYYVMNNGKKHLKLNTDVSIEGSIGIYADVTIDLNGHTITDMRSSSTSAVVFGATQSNITVTIEGEGKFANMTRYFFKTSNANAKEGVTLNINGYGDGITFDCNYDANTSSIIYMPAGFEFDVNIKGNVNVVPATLNYAHYFIEFGGDSDPDKLAVNIKGANITVEPAKDAEDYRWTSKQSAYFSILKKNAKINIDSSVIDMKHGSGFMFSAGSSYTVVTNDSAQVTARGDGVNKPVLNQFLTINNSTLAARCSEYSSMWAYRGAGVLFNVTTAPAEIKLNNTDLIGSTRSIVGLDTSTADVATAAKLYFNNVNFAQGDYIVDPYPYPLMNRLNIQWIGGKIDTTAWIRVNADTYTIKGMADSAADPFGANVKAYVIAQSGATTDQEKEAAWKNFVDKYKDNDGSDGSIYVVESKSESGGYTYNYYHMKNNCTNISLGCRAFEYSKLSDGDWYGILFEDVYFVNSLPDSKHNETDSAGLTYSINGAKYTNVSSLGGKKNYAVAFLKNPPAENKYDPYTNVYNPTSEWYGYPDGTKVPSNNIPMTPNSIAMSNNDYGTGYLVIGQNGNNGYFKYEIGADETDTDVKNPYIETKIGNSNLIANKDYTVSLNQAGDGLDISLGKTNDYSLQNYKYVIHEFDIATDDVFMGFDQIFLVARYTSLTAKKTDDGESYVYSINKAADSANATINLKIEAKTGLIDDTKASSKTSTMPSLATDGSWSRFTIVFEVGEWEKVGTYTLGGLTRDNMHLNVKMHVYLNGEWVSTYNQAIKSGINVDSELMGSIMLDAIRFQPLCNAEGEKSSICIDNVRTTYYKSNTTGYSDVASAMANPQSSLVGNAEFMSMPKNPIGTVDGVAYYTEASLISAMTDGCHVVLKRDLKNPLTASCAFTLDTNGYNVPAVYSTTHKIYRGENTIASRAAYAYELVKVHFLSTDFGISASVDATIGSDVNIPDSVKTEANPTVFKTEGGVAKYLNIAGWSVDNDGTADALLTLRDDLAYTVNGGRYEFKPVALVSRGDAASYVFLDVLGRVATDKIYVIPGEGVYPSVPKNLVTKNYQDKSGWYEIKFVSWETAKATEIAAAGYYELMPDVETKIPDKGIPGVKLNLSLYTDYELNIYIPKIESETVSNIKFTSDAGFTVPVESRGEVSIYGESYVKYFDRYGTADTNINSYYLSFEANGKTLVQKIDYGIPTYAATVMSMTDTAIGTTSKSLVMNMVNYAVKVLELANADMSSGGAYYYKQMLKKFGDEAYLDAYNKLERDDFLNPESSIYKEQIASLTYTTSLDSYIKSASFLFSTEAPVFVFEYGDAAKEIGIGAPKNLFCDPTAGGVYVLFGYGNETKNPVIHLAYNGGIIGGTNVTGTDVWGANTSSAISYYAYGDSYRYVDASAGGFHSAYNLLSPVSVDVMEGNTKLASGTYSLAAYISALLENNDTDYIDAACALYSYAIVADEFKREGAGVLPDEAIYTKKQSVLLIGQSNMVGANDLTVVDPIVDDRITMLRNDKWVPMKEPIHNNSSNAGAGIGATFAKAFVETFDCELGLIPAAVGGTNLNPSGTTPWKDTWAVGSPLYEEAIRLAKIAQQDSEICAILWHQGEGDQNSTQYAAKLQVIFDAMIEELGLDPDKIIIVTGELFGTRSDAVHMGQLEELGKHYKNYGIAMSDGLTVTDVTTHFDAQSMRVFGYRYFDIFYNLLTGKHYDFVDDPLHYLLPPTSRGDVVISDVNFNEYETGTAVKVNGVTDFSFDGTSNITIEEATETEKYLKLASELKDGTYYGQPYFDAYCNVEAGSLIVLEAKIKLDNTTDLPSFDLFKIIETRNGSNEGVYTALRVIVEDGAAYVVNVVGDSTNNGACDDFRFKLDYMEWTTIRVEVDITANTKTVYFNNQPLIKDAKFINNDHKDFAPTHVRVVHFNKTTSKGAICVDEYKLSVLPFAYEDFNKADTGRVEIKSVASLVIANGTDKSYVSVEEKNVNDNYLSVIGGDDKSPVFIDLNTTGTEKISKTMKYTISADILIEEGSTLEFNWFMPLIKYADVDENGVQKTDDKGALLWKTTPGIVACSIAGNVLYNGYNGAKSDEIYTFTYGEWVNIKMELDLENNTKVIYINDIAITDELALCDASRYPGAFLRGLRVFHLRGAGEGSFSFDNLKIFYN